MDVSANKDVSGDAFVVGVDFGTLSARAFVVRVGDGAEAGTAVSQYPHGVIDGASRRRAAPGLGAAGPGRLHRRAGRRRPGRDRDAGIDPGQVIGIATDFTASTCMPVLADATPLCQLPGLATRPHAYPKLWKHHAAQPHADRINAVAHERGEKWINRYGGKISSEWQFAKALQLLEEDSSSTSAPTGGSRPPTGSSGSCAGPRPGTRAPPGTRASSRTAATRPASTWPRSTRASPVSPRQARPSHSPLGPGRGADPGRGRADRAARGHRGGRRQRGRARHGARGRPGRGGQDGGDHGHLDLPRR